MSRLVAVGVGPGDPGLITRRGAAEIAGANVVAYFSGTGKSSVARAIAADLIDGQDELDLRFPVTTGATEGYYEAITAFYDEAADRLRDRLRAGLSVALLAEGDAFFYGSFMYLFDRLRDEFEVSVVPGVTSVQGASAAVGPLTRHEDVLTVLPGTLPVAELARRLADTQAAVIMKLGRTFPGVVEALRQADLLERAVYVERATSDRQRVAPVSEVDPQTVPYMSIVVVPGQDLRADRAGRARPAPGPAASPAPAVVHVVGLGPGPERWLTPEASQVLAEVDHVVGYAPYVNRVPQRAGLVRHASGNTVEVERARAALDLALAGERVAVVSGGDAGIFGMASAVFEAAQDERYAGVEIEVHPGLTAAQAAAAKAGAALGADWAMVSLSDRLKPWEVIENRLTRIAQADLALAIYNPRSVSRPDLLGRAQEVLLRVHSPETVVVIARDIGRAAESVQVTTLGELDPTTVDMKCLVIVGSSHTRVTPGGRVWTPRFVRG
ncbi:MAG: precorrin-3B C(17)-methyltransferase [Propionibacteriaceae bacterium]|nr:precorrin-3B C(17)-methyltransferase [Propionibacteriaceae bacterium]